MPLFTFLKNLFSSQPSFESLDGLRGTEYADVLFHNLVVEQKIPGISATIMHKGEIVLQKGHGYSNLGKKQSIDPQKSIFRIASISKCVTGLTLGKMVEEGLLDWDDSFYNYVPHYPKKKHDFSLRQLASHTAGIRGYRGKEFALNQPYSIGESIEVFKDDPLVFAPGKGYLYNSFDFVLLSLAMQEASGVNFEDYVKEKVLIPLGMQDTITPREVHELPRSIGTKFYTKRTDGFREAVEVNNFYKLAGGGYLSTSWDIAKMGKAILEQRLLKKETYKQLFAAHKANGKSTYYGLGFQVSQDLSGNSFFGHVGNSVGAYTNFFVYPDEQLVVSLLINCTDPKVQQAIDTAIAEIINGIGIS